MGRWTIEGAYTRILLRSDMRENPARWIVLPADFRLIVRLDKLYDGMRMYAFVRMRSAK